MTLELPWPQLNPTDRKNEVIKYFAGKAEQYDEVDKQLYWAFSDELLWELLKSHVLVPLRDRKDIKLLDAGAGTGRWSLRILQFLPNCEATLFDVSPDMLSVARAKFEKSGVDERTRFIESDLHQLGPEMSNQYDLIICFHNVLSFVSDPNVVIATLAKMVAPNGNLVLVVPNYYHAAYFSAAQRRWTEIERIQERWSVKFADDVPEMLLFSPTLLNEMLSAAGMKDINVLGFPVTVYPQMEETTISASSKLAASLFSDPIRRNELLRFELELSNKSEAAARGNNLLVIAKA